MIATCPKDQTLQEFAFGKLSDSQTDEVTDHVRDCSDCQKRLAEVDRMEDTMVGQLRDSTVNDSFQNESECQIAMAKALGALAHANQVGTTDELCLPRSIGEYDIVRQIGRGGMGSVYLAQHTKLNRKVAVKVLAASRLSDPRMHDRFKTEMRAVGSLSHPNIVTAHDAREVDGVALLVTEWIDGLDLRDILRRVGPLSVANTCAIGCEVAKALSYVAQQNLVHRDLKPSNVMINRDGDVKLLDLGLARLLSGEDDRGDATATGQALGTADYVAPEQINDAHAVDIRADIYGLGCTLFQLLTGRAPFDTQQHQTAFAKMTAHVSESPAAIRSIVPQVPVVVATLVDRMLAKSPENRPASPDEILRVLQPHAKQADLSQLIDSAMRTTAAASDDSDTRGAVATIPQPFWRRRVPVTVAIATGLGGLLLGLLAGVLITIRHADGTETKIDAPKNSTTIIRDDGDSVDVILDGSATPDAVTDAKPDATSDVERLSGVWVVEATADGGEMKSVARGELTFVFHEPNFAIFGGQQAASIGTVVVDQEAKRLKFVERTGEKVTRNAVYRFLADGRLEICINERQNGQVPTTFQSSKDPTSPNDLLLQMSRLKVPADAQSMLIFSRDPSNQQLLGAVSMHRIWLENVEFDAQLYADAVKNAQAATDASTSNKNLKQMGIAFHNYHDVYKVLPASRSEHKGSTTNGPQLPPFSLRVAILPFINCSHLYDQYRFDEPWDSEHNSKLLSQMPDIYRRPGAAADSTSTGYVGIVGEGSALGDTVGVGFRDLRDGTSNTLLLVEARTEIPWTKPEDFSISPDDFPALDRFGEDFVRAVMADGSVREFRPLSEEAIREAANGNDGKYQRRQ